MRHLRALRQVWRHQRGFGGGDALRCGTLVSHPLMLQRATTAYLSSFRLAKKIRCIHSGLLRPWLRRPCPCGHAAPQFGSGQTRERKAHALTSDFLIPLASSDLQVCGSANVPFSSERALRIAMRRGIHFVPEAISSAGAVLADSLEFYDPDVFYGVREPQPVRRPLPFLISLSTSEQAQLRSFALEASLGIKL